MQIFLVLFFLSLKSLAIPYDYKKFWTDSGLVKSDSESAFAVEIKTSPLLSKLPIATVSYTKNNKEPKEKIISILKKSVTAVSWAVENIDGLEFHESYSKQSGTIYRLAFNNKNNEFSLASIPVRYLLPTYIEAHLIQVKHLNGVKSKTNKFTQFIQLFINNSHAETFTLPSNLPNINLDTAQLGDAIKSLGPEFSNLNSTIGSAAASANNVAGSINNISQTARDITSPANVAKTAAVAGAAFGISSTISSMATNFMLHGTMSMLRTLYYEAAGEMKPEEKEARIKRFENSMKLFTELSPRLAQLGSKMAATSVEIALASGMTQEQYLAKIDEEIESVKKAKTEAKIDCAEFLSGASLRIQQLENLKDIVKATGNKTRDDMQKSCENMDNLYSEWVNAEYVMLNSRRLILQDLLIFNGQIVENSQQQDAFQEDRKKVNTCKVTSEKIIREINLQIDVEKCNKDESNMSLPICRRYFAHTEILKNCDSIANTQLSESQKVELDEATARLSTSLADFSKSLAAMSCEKEAPSCSKAQMNIVRNEVSESFKAAAEKCPGRAFAVAMKKSTGIKKPVVNVPPVQDNRNFLQRILDKSDNPNKNVARDPMITNN